MGYEDIEYLLSVGLLTTAMFGMGATLTAHDFVKVARVPQAIGLMLLVQVLLSPLAAIAIARLLYLPPGITIGLVLIAALPGGLFSNVIAYLGRGNVALSVSATALASLSCLLTTSLVLRLVSKAELPPDFQMPTRVILSEIALCMILPLALGMIVRRNTAHHAIVARLFIRLSMVILTIFILAAIVSGRVEAAAYGWRPLAALFLFACVCLWLCYGLGGLIRLSLNDRFTIGTECVVRNVQLGVLLKARLFPPGSSDTIGDGMLYSLLVYGGLCMIVAGVEAFAKRQELGLLYGAERKNRQRAQKEAFESAEADAREEMTDPPA